MAATAICVPSQLVNSRTVRYHASIVDLRWCQAIHSCEACPVINDALFTCGSVHYGHCLPLKQKPVPMIITNSTINSKKKIQIPIIVQNSKPDREPTVPNTNTFPSTGINVPPAEISRLPISDATDADFLKLKKEALDQKREFEKAKLESEQIAAIKNQNIDQNKRLSQEDSSLKTENQIKLIKTEPEISPILTDNKIEQRSDLVLKQSDNYVNKLQISQKPNEANNQELTGKYSNVTILVKPFYYPHGMPDDNLFNEDESFYQNVAEEFKKNDNKIYNKNVSKLTKICKLPLYWKNPFFNFFAESKDHITIENFDTKWKRLKMNCKNRASLFIYLCSMACHNYLEYDDFLPIVQDVVDNHPGLAFLQDAPEFHSRYIQTVISRIFYCVNRSWSGKITLQEIQNSNLLKTIDLLEEEDDINQITEYFSYEHFYVIYCKFWELDQDHDLLISEADLARHCNHAISSRMIHRIFSGAVTRNMVNGKLSYKDFVWFLISEEDKRHPTSIEYWFRCMDLDGDGCISMYEMEHFYEEQIKKMEMLDIETLPFVDCLCQMLDMVNPIEPGRIRLRDLKSCALTPIFFDTFFNLEKYLRHEQKDPFSSIKDADEMATSDWERFAADEYELLVSEEGVDQQADNMYEDEGETSNSDVDKAALTKP